MRIKFTTLIETIVMGIFVLPAIAQNTATPMTIGKKSQVANLELKESLSPDYHSNFSDIESRAAVATDSSIVCSASGEYLEKFVTWQNGNEITYKGYKWVNKNWVYDPDLYPNHEWFWSGNPGYVYEDGMIKLTIPTGGQSAVWTINASKSPNAEYDKSGKLVSLETADKNIKFAIKYNINGKPISIDQYEKNVHVWKAIYEYDATFGTSPTLFESYSYDKTKGVWLAEKNLNKVVRTYEVRASVMKNSSIERYNAVSGTGNWVRNSKTEYVFDDNFDAAIKNEYIWYNNKWTLLQYTIYYPNTLTSPSEPEETTPVDNTNQGSFDLNTILVTDSIHTGSLVVQLPDGFTLDETNTNLTLDFAGLFDLKITKQGNNSWLFEISPKSTKSMLLSGESATKMLHIAYNVDETLVRGIYDISINNILFETKGGNLIPEPAITVPVSVNRWGVDNEYVNNTKEAVYINNNTLYIQTTQTENIAVYAPNGMKLYEAKIQPGMTTISAANFPKGILFVKGSSGWVQKVILH